MINDKLEVINNSISELLSMLIDDASRELDKISHDRNYHPVNVENLNDIVALLLKEKGAREALLLLLDDLRLS